MRTDDAAYDEESVKAFAKEGNISVSETEAFLEMRKAIKPPTTISKSLEAFVSIESIFLIRFDLIVLTSCQMQDKVCKVFTNSSEELKPRNDWDGTSNALAISRLRIALANKRLDLATRMTNFVSKFAGAFFFSF